MGDESKRYGPPHFERDGYVSIWANIASYDSIPESYLEENYSDETKPLTEFYGDFGFGYFDHDFLESFGDENRQPIRSLLECLSYSSSFIDEAEQAAKLRNVVVAEWVILLYNFDYQSSVTNVTESKYFRFIGSFPYDESSKPVREWQSM